MWSLDGTSGALHERVAASIRRAISSGELPPGAALPTAKELAGSLGVNANTVLRAFAVLSDEGLIEVRRRRGAVVTARADRARLIELADALHDEAARLGITRGELTLLLARRS